MSIESEARSVRFARWWVRRYTAGLAGEMAAERREEIDSDIAEHQRGRELDGWPPRRIAQERTTRLLRGMAADVAWRHEVLCRPADHRFAFASIRAVTTLASLLVAGFHLVFAAYLLGSASLAEQRFLGGMANYADKVDNGLESTIAALVLAALALTLATAAATRPISPRIANVATLSVGAWSVLFFWLGVWPLGLIAVIGSAIDLATRDPGTRPAS